MNRLQLVCARCSAAAAYRYTDTRCACGGTLLIQYDLERIGRTLSRSILRSRVTSMWRYRELLPLQDAGQAVTLGEGWTPLIRLRQGEAGLPLKELWIKREEQNPTGSFKARGFSAAVSLLKERGVRKTAVPSNGNAAGALAAYAARAGMEAAVFLPKDCPPLIVQECVLYGADTFLVDGLIHDAGALIEDGSREQGWTSVATLKEFGRVEGKKTMGLELAEQLGWQLPDVILYPTGGGSGIIGLWKAFCELRELGWTQGALPRLVSVQEEGCQPIVDAMNAGGLSGSGRSGGSTVTSSPTGMRVPLPPDLALLTGVLRETAGTAVAVSSPEIRAAAAALGAQGISASPEGAATWAGLLRLCDAGWIRPSDRVVLFNTAHAMKYTAVGSGSFGPGPRTEPIVPIVKNYGEYVSIREQRLR